MLVLKLCFQQQMPGLSGSTRCFCYFPTLLLSREDREDVKPWTTHAQGTPHLKSQRTQMDDHFPLRGFWIFEIIFFKNGNSFIPSSLLIIKVIDVHSKPI